MKNCKTQLEIIVAFLWSEPSWHATHELQNRATKFGFIGSAGHTRARELARNDVPDYLKGKVERKRGAEVGLDPRFEFFRYRPQLSDKHAAAMRVRLFDAGAPAEQVLAV